MKTTADAPSVCYSYDILVGLCMLVKSSYDSFAQVNWEYVGGCFADNAHALYKPAQPGEVFSFENVQIEVRQANEESILDLSLSTFESEDYETSTIAWLFYALCFLFLVAALVAGLLLFSQMFSKKKAEGTFTPQRDEPQ